MPAKSISTEELQGLLASGQPVTVLAIRASADRDWSIPGSVQVDAYVAVNSRSLGPINLEFGPGPIVTKVVDDLDPAPAAHGLSDPSEFVEELGLDRVIWHRVGIMYLQRTVVSPSIDNLTI